MTDWTPVFVLPNIPLETAVGCDIAALAPAKYFPQKYAESGRGNTLIHLNTRNDR